MATSTNVTTSYAGEFSAPLVSKALFSATTLDNELIRVMPNIKYKTILKKLATGDLIQSADCDFTANSSVTLTERELEVKPLKVNITICKRIFHDDYMGKSMQASAMGRTMPADFQSYLIEELGKKVGAEMESRIWNSTSDFDGFEVLMAADADVTAVAGTAITKDNVLEEIEKLHASVGVENITNPDLRFYVSQSIASKYVLALGGFAVAGLGANGVNGQGSMWYDGQSLTFAGIPIVVANGLNAGSMVATLKDNLVFGCSLKSDLQSIKIIDMESTTGDDNVRYIMKFEAGVNYTFAEDISYYSVA